jgi:hypothetical protein
LLCSFFLQIESPDQLGIKPKLDSVIWHLKQIEKKLPSTSEKQMAMLKETNNNSREDL